MVTKEEAYEIAKEAYPDKQFTGLCVDYKNTWAFPYKSQSEIPSGDRIFVIKDDGTPVPNDPAFKLELWISCDSYQL